MNQEQEMRTRALELLGQNANSDEVMRKTGLSKMQVAALKAHITMGTYSKRPVTQPTPSPSPRPSLAREDERYDLARRLAEEGRQNAYIRAQTGLGKMQVAGFLAASSRKKRNLESKAGATSLHQTDLLTTPEIQPETDNRQSITKQEAIELMTTKGVVPAKLAYAYRIDGVACSPEQVTAWRAHITMGTYAKHPELLIGNNHKNGGNGKTIRKKEQLVDFIVKSPEVRDLSVLALCLGEDGSEIEGALLEIYQGRFKSREELHSLLEEAKDDVERLLNEGVISLGYFIGRYSLRDRTMAPIFLGGTASNIPIERATPSLERTLMRVASGIYDPQFNEDPIKAIKDLQAKAGEGKNLAKRIYETLSKGYQEALALKETLKSFALRT